jgi:hypothetical protein
MQLRRCDVLVNGQWKRARFHFNLPVDKALPISPRNPMVADFDPAVGAEDHPDR